MLGSRILQTAGTNGRKGWPVRFRREIQIYLTYKAPRDCCLV